MAHETQQSDSQRAMSHRLCVAPMMDWTDRHCRYFHRLLAPTALLYTEMVTTGAVINGDRERLLGFSKFEQPVALQLGGSDPAALATSAKIGAEWGYDEINLNVGCPSDRVQAGRFGACLMKEPELVAECVAAMRAAVDVPVTVKTRLGVDDLDNDEHLHGLVAKLVETGCDTLLVHARKAWLSGLSPKQNRDVPPLQYDRVYRLKEAFPALTVVINGGIGSLEESQEHLKLVDGVMLGRVAYQRPYELAKIDAELSGRQLPSREQVVASLRNYCLAHIEQGGKVRHVIRHTLGLYHGQPRGRIWRRILGEESTRPGAGIEVLDAALAAVSARPEPAKVASRA